MSARVTYVGHSTLLLEIDGTTLLTDPVLRSRVAILRRLTPVPELPGLLAPDAVLISHAHPDHLDFPSMRRISTAVPAVTPRGLARLIARTGDRASMELEPGQSVVIGAAEITATPANHNGRRHPMTRRLPALGFVVRGAGSSVYFAGDTDLFDEMQEFAAGVDVALLPVGGWGRQLRSGHLDPERAARAAALLRPRVAVPIHWGTLVGPAVSRERALAPAGEFARFAASLAPGVEVRALQPGDAVALGPRDP